MSFLRVTVGSEAYTSIGAIQSASSELARLQAQLSSGKRIQQPSDDPTGTVQALTLQSGLARNDQYATNAQDALAWLSSADTTYGQLVDVVQKASTAVTKGLNTGASDPDARAALADEVDGLRSTLLGLANAQYNGRPLFGGTTAGGAAYDATGTYVGDTGTVSREVGPGQQVQVSATGPQVFGSGTDDVFALLSQVSSQLRTDPSALSGSLTKLTAAVSRLSAAQSTEGAAYSQVERAQTEQTANGTAMTTRLAGIEDIDLAEMAVKVTSANVAYQAALQTTANVRQLSLMDFLR